MTPRLRPRTPASSTPVDEVDDLAGIEAFAPHDQGSADDPFVKAFAEERRPRHARRGPPAPAAPARGARPLLVVAVLVLLLGVVAAVAGGDDGDRDLAVTQSSTTTVRPSTTVRPTTTSRPLVTPSTIGSTSTSALFPGLGAGTETTAATTRTTRPLTTPTLFAPATTTTAPRGNQPMVVSITLDPAAPFVGDDVTVTVRFSDPDAPSSSNCRTITVEDGPRFEDPCAVPDCTDSGGAAGGGVGGYADVTFHVTWSAAGEYDIDAAGQSLQPYCGDRFGSEATGTVTVTVADPQPGA